MDLLQYENTPLSKMKERYSLAKYDPTSLVKVGLETIEEITEEKALLVDATNPAVMLLEMGATLAANCIHENISLLKKQYPALAQNEEDLYLHMSDEDYLNRFASPAKETFTFAFQVNDILSKAVRDDTERNNRLVIPRDTTIDVDGVTFSLLYPIVIRNYDNGVTLVSYDPEIKSPITPLKRTSIDYSVRKGSSQEQWLFFDVELVQVKDTTHYAVIDKTYNFSKKIVLDDQFYHARVFYANDASQGKWIEVTTTHTDQVFDITKPTAVLKVKKNELEVSVPVIYTTTGAISGQIRIDVYTTKGAISMNLRNYRQDAFTVSMKAIDEKRDIDAYALAMSEVSFYAFSLNTVAGGSNGISFEELRNRVIYNAIGPQNLPITNVQLEAEANNQGFEIVKDIDTLTNRVFLATRKLPAPSNPKLITPANIGMVTYASDLATIRGHHSVVDNGDRITIRSKALFRSDNGRLYLAPQSEIDQVEGLGLTMMVSHLNKHQYFYTPFYYVLDSSEDEFELRSYSLDQPYAKDLNFIQQNQTLQLTVNTGSYALTKVNGGYEFRIITKSGNFYRNIEDSQVGVQLAFYPKGETTYAYINAVQEKVLDDGERAFLFKIETNHDINSQDLICITNAEVQGIPSYEAWIDLETRFEVIHYTTSITDNYRPNKSDEILGKFILPPMAAGNSHESITLHLGSVLKNLWKRSRSYLLDQHYRKHTVDIPLHYESDVFDRDPVTGSAFKVINGEIVYQYLHREGDPVLDTNGNQVYLHRAGDTILDENGKPVVDYSASIGKEVDLLVVDGRYLFSNDLASVAYRSEIEAILEDWITGELDDIQQRLLEQTKIFFYPKTTLGDIKVYTDNNGEDYLNAEQVFTVDLYVPYSIYNDSQIRDQLKRSTVKLLDKYISQQTVNMSEVRHQLRLLYGTSVEAFKVSGLGGVKDYQVVTMASERNKLCLQKQLVIQADKTLITEDGVDVQFKLVS